MRLLAWARLFAWAQAFSGNKFKRFLQKYVLFIKKVLKKQEKPNRIRFDYICMHAAH